ncbi:GNAT family N-acetyltransferase [Musicola keenii]|uniref:GNAT family N-acetyltransferase n=1 Tax=Musicola keenii TaxID=2884250 RepID=UPI00177AA2C9|nr:GNAT family N-acetyltransferase [Musicola keenii]
MQQPSLTTTHLQLRPLRLTDALVLTQLLNSDPRIAAMTVQIPYPCPRELIERWITGLEDSWTLGQSAAFAICLQHSRQLIGVIALSAMDGDKPEIGYWLTAAHWHQGLGTQACRAMCQFAFTQGVRRIYACHLPQNVASGKVLLKSGFHALGFHRVTMVTLRQRMRVAVYRIEAPVTSRFPA